MKSIANTKWFVVITTVSSGFGWVAESNDTDIVIDDLKPNCFFTDPLDAVENWKEFAAINGVLSFEVEE